MSILIFIKPKIRKSADVFGIRRHICRRTQLADVLGLYVGVYAQRIASAPIGVNRIQILRSLFHTPLTSFGTCEIQSS